MEPLRKPVSEEKRAQIQTELRRDAEQRRSSYRIRALSILPHICVSCGREFEGKRLKELTVHHKDHNHNNNPPDGSNWELLCLYCHDHEHEKSMLGGYYESGSAVAEKKHTAPSVFSPFANLDALIKKDDSSTQKK